MYKIEQPFNDFLSYEYNDSKEMSYMFMNSTSAISEHALSSANDIILDWTKFAKEALEGEYAEAKPNPITGQHVELTVQSASNGEVDKVGLKTFLAALLPNHMMPKRIRIASLSVGHRFKRA